MGSEKLDEAAGDGDPPRVLRAEGDQFGGQGREAGAGVGHGVLGAAAVLIQDADLMALARPIYADANQVLRRLGHGGAPFPSLAPHRGASVVPVLALLGATSHWTLAPRQPRGGAVHRRCCLRTGGSWHSPRGGRVATSEMVQGEVAPALDSAFF